MDTVVGGENGKRTVTIDRDARATFDSSTRRQVSCQSPTIDRKSGGVVAARTTEVEGRTAAARSFSELAEAMTRLEKAMVDLARVSAKNAKNPGTGSF